MRRYLNKNHNKRDLPSTCLPELEHEEKALHRGLDEDIKLVRKSAGAGFSLIELLVGMAITVTATTIILAIVMSAFRVSSKATTADLARQNGNYAMNRMIKMIQFADSYNGRSTSLLSTAGESGYRVNDCDGSNNTAISITYKNEEKILQCRGHNSLYLIDPVDTTKNEQLIRTSSVAVSNCNISCLEVRPGASPVITIKFDLTIGESDAAIEKRSSIPFRTSVKMRNK